MNWRKRLAELALAGGLVGLGGCTGSPSTTGTSGTTTTVPACNANPDPCCSAPDGGDCMAKHACESAGAEYAGDNPSPDCRWPDGGIFPASSIGSGSTSGSGGTT